MDELTRKEIVLLEDILLERVKKTETFDNAMKESITEKISNCSENLKGSERNILLEAFSERLIQNWTICDKAGMGSFEYENATDECGTIRSISRKLLLNFPDSIASRF